MGTLDENVKNQLKQVEHSLSDINDFIKKLEESDYETLTKDLTPLEKAQFDITLTYAINSLFWMYIRSDGQNPNEHGIKGELDRIKGQMQRLQQIKDKSKRPQVDTEAAERMIRHGINKQKKRKRQVEENWDDDNEAQEAGPSSCSTKDSN